jgi:hypothetical protein
LNSCGSRLRLISIFVVVAEIPSPLSVMTQDICLGLIRPEFPARKLGIGGAVARVRRLNNDLKANLPVAENPAQRCDVNPEVPLFNERVRPDTGD